MPQGQLVQPAPADGLTTRQRRQIPITAVFTGDGKGKSTAAFGMALRAWNAGIPLAVFQFVKSPQWKVGEETAFRELGALHDTTGRGAPVDWNKLGSGWSWIRHHQDDDPAAAAAADWAEITRRLADEEYGFYLLDEFTYVLERGWVDCEQVIDTLQQRPGQQHVVITGRRAPAELIAAADLVTSMEKIKHPMDVGRRGQKGIEW